MKKLSLVLGVILFYLNFIKAQEPNQNVDYVYSPNSITNNFKTIFYHLNGKHKKHLLIKQKLVDFTKKYLPEYEKLISENCVNPYDIKKYINGKKVKNDLVNSEESFHNSFITILHESIHKKYEVESERDLLCYFINLDKNIYVKPDYGFYHSYYLINVIDNDEIRTITDNSYEYIITYLFTKDYNSNIKGIYGLLSEYNAYAHEYNAILKLSQLNDDTLNQNVKEDALKEVINIPDIYYAFNLMIGWYIEYAKQFEVDSYQKLYESFDLREAFAETNCIFESMMETYNKMVNDEIIDKHYDYLNNLDYEGLIELYDKQKEELNKFKI